VLLVVKVNALLLDILKLVVLCMKHVHVSYDTGVPKVIKGVVDDKVTSAAGVEDSVVGVFNTRTMEVGSGKGSCMKGGAIDGLVLALCPLMDYSVIGQEIMDIFGSMWSGICPNKDKGVMAGVARIKTHPLAIWMISVLHVFCLGRGVGYLCWGCDTLEEGRWRGVD